MRKTIIKVGYTSYLDEPYEVFNINGYIRGEILSIDESDLLDIDETMQITNPLKESSHGYIIELIFKEKHMLFNMLTINQGINLDVLDKIGDQMYWYYDKGVRDLVLDALQQALNILKERSN